MSVQALEKPATDRQMVYIRRLQAELGSDTQDVGNVSAAKASMIIGDLVAEAQKRNGVNGQKKLNEARLGMAMKECYRAWVRGGWDIFRNDERKDRFVSEVIAIYNLFTEIVERVSAENVR